MTRILITGISGTGKSTVGNILRQRGYAVIETDDPGWCVPEDEDWSRPDHEWIWDESSVSELLDTHTDQHVVIIGCRQNQGKFYSQIEQIVVLTVPIDVLQRRIAERASNPFGKQPEQMEHIEATKREVEPLLIRGANLVIDSAISAPEHIADQLESLL
ncbi:MAG: AAA family ATPase [Thermomicrobiales bacterium]|nr:AAA family ATPase [Thermomicrobiales bacterium]MCO5217827.1 AAA family ATPase [Thermomicrobiales bacterium]MCO5223915.1 AAA family ATPase [Thermomicrobiales bacterium]MCO5227478.1 AAA family ATPase [Thermomicrobiales bacterium]